MKKLFFLAALFMAAPLRAQSCDSAFAAWVHVHTDSIVAGGAQVSTVLQSQYVPPILVRAAAKIDSAVAAQCKSPPPPPPPPPISSAPSTPPTLPQKTVDVSWRAPTGRTWLVDSGGNLQTVLNLAQRGDEIVVESNARFVGNYSLPAKSGSCSDQILVRSGMTGALPPLGMRVQPSDSVSMPRLSSPNVVAALVTENGACGWRLVGLNVTRDPNVSVGPTAPRAQGLIYLGYNGVASDIVLDRVYVHSNPQTNEHRCILLNSGATAIIGSQILECHGKGFDSQGIGGWAGSGPYLIENNRIEAAGQPILFGGAVGPVGNVPSDITIRRNYLGRPMSWKGVWSIVFLFELKNAQRVLIEENVMENHWRDVKDGSAIMLGTLDNPCSWCVVADITFRWNSVDNVKSVFNIIDKYGNAQPARRIQVYQNLITNVGSNTLGSGLPRCFMLQEIVDDLWIEHNSCGAPYGFVALSGQPKQRFTFRANEQTQSAQYPWWSSFGMGNLTAPAYPQPSAVDSNTFVAPLASLVPSGNGNVRLTTWAARPGVGVDRTILAAKLANVR